MPVDAHYTDPRLVATYDLENAGTWDHDFYAGLAASLGARRVADLGCGTGVLAVQLAAAGAEVVGVDPAPAMLAVARARPGGTAVRWVDGDAAALPTAWADLVLMTGHVAQVFTDDAAWATVLAACVSALRPGGRVAFESRNPVGRPWEAWTPERTRDSFELAGDTVTTWVGVTGVDGGTVHCVGHNVRASTGEDVQATSSLRFRTLAELEGTLAAAELAVEARYGDWEGGPLLPDSRELILVAGLAR